VGESEKKQTKKPMTRRAQLEILLTNRGLVGTLHRNLARRARAGEPALASLLARGPDAGGSQN